MFFNILVPEGGHEVFDHPIVGNKNIAKVLSDIRNPLNP